jgi:hypothetical protein
MSFFSGLELIKHDIERDIVEHKNDFALVEHCQCVVVFVPYMCMSVCVSERERGERDDTEDRDERVEREEREMRERGERVENERISTCTKAMCPFSPDLNSLNMTLSGVSWNTKLTLFL